MAGAMRGLARAAAVSAQRGETICRIKQERGIPVVGYLCCFAPPELMAAAGVLPYRITGRPGDTVSEADAYMEPYGCSYVRNIMAQAAKGRFDFLDGLVISHSCDMVQRLYGLWTYYRPLPYSRLFNVPHQVSPQAQRFFIRELGFFKESLEKYTGKVIPVDRLLETIHLANRNRALIRELYALRRLNPAPVEGSEMLDLLIAGSVLPADEFGLLLEEALEEVRARAAAAAGPARPRLLVWGSLLDDSSFYRLIEEAGGQVVADDTCIGFRAWDQDIPLTGDPFADLTAHYLVSFQCPRTDRGPGRQRFQYILDRAREYGCRGVVGYVISFCDPHKFDYPDLRDMLKEAGLPMLLIDDNYSFAPAGALQTRLQAFVEILTESEV